MRSDQLIPGEKILSFSDTGLITLTTHRIRYQNERWGESDFKSIMLEKISSLQVVFTSYPVLLVIGILVGLMGMIVIYNRHNDNSGGIAGLVIGIAFIIAYFVTKRHVCVIASDGGSKIVFKTEGMSTGSLIDMMDKIELAKHSRITELRMV